MPRYHTALWLTVATTVIVTPLVVTPRAYDPFRTPKDVVFSCLALVLLAMLAGGVLWREDVASFFRERQPALLIALAGIGWTALTATTSLLPLVSRIKPLQVLALAVFFAAALLAVRGRGLEAVLIAMIPAVVNAVMALLQSTGIWSPWPPKGDNTRVWTTGLIGNPNEVGSWFVFSLLAALAAAVAWRKWWLGAITLLVGAGLLSSQSVSPLLAGIAGLVAFGFVVGSRRARAIVLIAAIALPFVALIHPANRARLNRMRESATSGRLPELTSFRVAPAMAAWMMFRDRPLLGVGPGVFAARYLEYKTRVDEAHPEWIRDFNQSFGEAHNDHLQVLAETGLPGYAIFAAALVLLASLSFRGGPAGSRRTGRLAAGGPLPRERFGRLFGFPAAAAMAVMALAQFPLQLTAPMVTLLYCSALAFAWTRSDESA